MVRETLGSLCGALSDAACSAGSGPGRCKHHRTASVKTTAHEAGGGPVIFVARSVESVRKRWIFPAAASELRDEHGKRLYVAGTRKCPKSTGLEPASRSRRAAVLLLSPQWMRSGLLTLPRAPCEHRSEDFAGSRAERRYHAPSGALGRQGMTDDRMGVVLAHWQCAGQYRLDRLA